MREQPVPTIPLHLYTITTNTGPLHMHGADGGDGKSDLQPSTQINCPDPARAQLGVIAIRYLMSRGFLNRRPPLDHPRISFPNYGLGPSYCLRA